MVTLFTTGNFNFSNLFMRLMRRDYTSETIWDRSIVNYSSVMGCEDYSKSHSWTLSLIYHFRGLRKKKKKHRYPEKLCSDNYNKELVGFILTPSKCRSNITKGFSWSRILILVISCHFFFQCVICSVIFVDPIPSHQAFMVHYNFYSSSCMCGI